ncbi:MAG: UDP-4-amino-4,6-dideoxy-N-acetyl-beta-L-altrosamine transaminase [Eubacteriales bacterium]
MPSLLAIEGGQPVRQEMLPYGQQWIEDDDIEAVANVLKSSFLTTGPKIAEFEALFAKYVGAKYAVAVANGTAALHAAVFAAGIRHGDEVISSPVTFAASTNCILYQGGTAVFADVGTSDGNIDPVEVSKKVTQRTKAVIPVHFTGLPVDLREIHEIAKSHNLTVIEDAAHALGATYQGEKIGGLSHMTIFSFHPVKNITTGEGGMVTTNDQRFYKRLISFRTHGITREKTELSENHGPWYYEMNCLGYNYRLTDVQAALGISQLAKIDRFLQRRKEIAGRYMEAFSGMIELSVPEEKPDRESGWHLYVIRLNTQALRVGRRQVFEALRAENIGVNVHYIPVYLHPYYRSLGYSAVLCPEAERLYSEIISLPLFPKMRDRDVDDVISSVRKVVTYYRK